MAVKLTKKEKREVRNRCIGIIISSLIFAFLLSLVVYYLVYKCNKEVIELLKVIDTKEKAINFCWVLGPIFFIVIATISFAETVIKGFK